MSAQDPTTSVDIEPTDQNNLNDQEYKELDGEVKEIWRQLCMGKFSVDLLSISTQLQP